ncbi:MAG: hypothetical protein ACFFAJ_16965 [Candidatus Hodarchaeota archaeon]
MKNRTQLLIVTLILFLMISLSCSTAIPQQDLEWKVKAGDSKTYVIEKWFDENDLDGDGDKNTETASVTDENDESVEVVFREGLTIKATITKLNDQPTVKFTYDGKVTTKEVVPILPMVFKTVDNQTYWEELAAANENITIEGDLIVNETTVQVDTVLIFTNIIKTNWKTGWVTYLAMDAVDGTQTVSEVIYSEKGDGVPGFEMAHVLLGLVVITLLVYKKRK